MFVVKCSLFGLMILTVMGGVRSLVALPQVEDNGIRKAELIIRTTMNTLFSNLKLESKKGRPRLQYFTLLHHYFITQTLEDQTTLTEIAKLTRVNKTAISNRMKIFITPLNELFEDEFNLFNEDYFIKPDNFDEADQFIEEYMRELEYKVNSNQSFDVDVEIAKLLVQHGKSKEFNDSKQDLDVWKPSLNLTISGRRIFDGTYTSIRHYPFIGSVKYFDDFLCSCSIIKTDLVITAASCLQIAYNNRLFRENPAYLSVQVGSTFYESSGETIDVLEIYFHPSYKPKTLENNLAIMRLKMRINFRSRMVKKIQVDGEANLPSAVDSILMLGWGATSTRNQIEGVLHNRLHYAILDFYSWVDCREIYTRELVTEQNFCAGYISKGGGACNKDAGAPGIVNGKLVGVASFGPSICGDIDKPTVFTKLYYYTDWIESILEKVPISYDAKTTLSPETLNRENIKQQILTYNLMKKALNKNKTESSSEDTKAMYNDTVEDTVLIESTIAEPLSIEVDVDPITETSYRTNPKSKSHLRDDDSYKFTRLNTDSHKRLTTNAPTNESTNEILVSIENKQHREKNKKPKKKAAKIRSPKYKSSEETSNEKSSMKTLWNEIIEKKEHKQVPKTEPLEKKKISSDEDSVNENSFKEKLASKGKLLKEKLSKEISSYENPIDKISSEKTKVKHKSKGKNSTERSWKSQLTELNDIKLSKDNNNQSIDKLAEDVVLQQNSIQFEDMKEREGKLSKKNGKKRSKPRKIPLTITKYPPLSSPETSLETKLPKKKTKKSKKKTSLAKETLKDRSTAMSSLEQELHDFTTSSITTQIQTELPYLREQRLMELLSKYQNVLNRHNLSLQEDTSSIQRENVIKQDESVTLPNIKGDLEKVKEKSKYTYNHESTETSSEEKLKEKLYGIGSWEKISSQAVKYQQFESNNTDVRFYNSKGDITTDIQVQKSENIFSSLETTENHINLRKNDVDFDVIEKLDDGLSTDDKVDSGENISDEFKKLDTILSSSESRLDNRKPQEIVNSTEIEKFVDNFSSLEGKSDSWKPDTYKSDETSKLDGKSSSNEDKSDNLEIDHSYKPDQTTKLSRENPDKKDKSNEGKAAYKLKSYEKHLSFSKHKQDDLRRHKIIESDKTISDENIEKPKNVHERRKHISKESSSSSEESSISL